MQNVENQAGQVRRNPSRDNKNINQGQGNEERIDSQTSENRDVSSDKKKFDGDENAVAGGGISDSTGNEYADERARKSQQKAAGKNSGNQQTESQDLQGTKWPESDNYDVNEQFDLDEDFGSSTRQ